MKATNARMKKRKSYRFLFFVNVIFAIALLVFYATSYISPVDYPLSGYLNLLTPIPFVINLIFLLYWVFKLKKYMLLSGVVLLLGTGHILNIYSFSNPKTSLPKEGFKLMSYNIMQFYNPEDSSKNTYEDILDFVTREDPDILCFQEFTSTIEGKFSSFTYKVENASYTKLKTVIFSKYPIIDSKIYDFVSNNSAIHADIIFNKDTIRVFSIHFESLNLKSQLEDNSKKPKLRYKQFKRVFPRQIIQFEQLKSDIINSPYPVMIGTDMNNTALSYLYRKMLSLDLKDSFLECGKGYGETFKLSGLPIRIDFIYTSQELTPVNFKNYSVNFSDHYPIMSSIKLNSSGN